MFPLPPHPGEPDAQRLAGDFSIRRRPGRDARGGQQWCSDPDGEGRPGLPQTGEREPNGRMEVLHLLRLPGVPHVEEEGEEEEAQGVETKEEELVEGGESGGVDDDDDDEEEGKREKRTWWKKKKYEEGT